MTEREAHDALVGHYPCPDCDHLRRTVGDGRQSMCSQASTLYAQYLGASRRSGHVRRVRDALVLSPRWAAAVAKLNILALAIEPPLPLESATDAELAAIEAWAAGSGITEPDLLTEYVARVRARSAP